MSSSERKRLGLGLSFVGPWLCGFVAFTAVPIALSFYYSLTDYPLLREPVWVGIDNYAGLLWRPNEQGTHGDPVFWEALWNTFYYAAMALPAGLIVSLGVALLLNTRIAGQSLYRTIVFLPSLVPLVASAMLFMWLFNTRLGLINLALGTLGIDGPGWLTNPSWAMPALALMSLWGVGHTVIIFLAGLQDVPVELYEAAEIDGASAWGRLIHVTLPMISPVIFFNLIMALIGTLQVFAVPYIMTGGGPVRATYFYTMYLYDSAFSYLKFGHASAMAWIQFLLIVGLTGLAFWSSKRWVHYQGG
jgi:multiple sugar transport system permease protein